MVKNYWISVCLDNLILHVTGWVCSSTTFYVVIQVEFPAEECSCIIELYTTEDKDCVVCFGQNLYIPLRCIHKQMNEKMMYFVHFLMGFRRTECSLLNIYYCSFF